MICIVCLKKAVSVLNGNSLCKKHLIPVIEYMMGKGTGKSVFELQKEMFYKK